MIKRRAVLGALACVAFASCSADRGALPAEPADASAAPLAASQPIAESSAARARFEELRARFVMQPAPASAHTTLRAISRSMKPQAVIRGAAASGFERTADGRVHPLLPKEARRSVLRSATVELPARAGGAVRLEDDTTRVAIAFGLEGASDEPVAVADGLAHYARALDGADVIHRVHAEGTEDYVVFEKRPASEELRYQVDVSRAAGLRLVSNTLEFLDNGGTPRLRVAPPYVVDAHGTTHEAKLAVDGCAYDTDTSAPWGRPVTKAGAESCSVRVAWAGVAYPAIVDPSWAATGSMATDRQAHTATKLCSPSPCTGAVLVAGGIGSGGGGLALSTAELFDGTSSFSATGAMTARRLEHVATLLGSGKVLIAGGSDGASVNALSSAELFNGAIFTATGTMAAPRWEQTMTLLASGKVLVAGGYAAGFALSSAELFDGISSFTGTGSMAKLRYGHSATLLGSGKVLVAGGMDNSSTQAAAELFDGVSAFAATGAMVTARYHHTATLLGSGKVLVAGGEQVQSGNGLSNAELFDGTSIFAATGSMLQKRMYHTATLLTAGEVLIAGGYDGMLPYYSTAEIFEEAAGFASTNSMTTARAGHSATLLGSGKVLVTGGVALSTSELFVLSEDGGTCTAGSDCVSGLCEDGVCCSSACTGACKTCVAGTGACATVTNADDPSSCTGNNTCDATGSCKSKQGQPCTAPADCANGICVDAYCCDTGCGGACDRCNLAGNVGTCSPAPLGDPGQPACSPAVCDGASGLCPGVSACTSDANCVSGYYCAANGQCTSQKIQAAACDTSAGADCKSAGCAVCATGFCADGFCCNSACDSACMSCSTTLKGQGPDGTCGNTAADSDPKNQCPVDSDYPTSCKADGMCDGNGACRAKAKSTVACGATTCSGDSVSGLLCNGVGGCVPSATAPCTPYLCTGGKCAVSCTVDAECTQSAYCTDQKTCALKKDPGAVCAKDHECSQSHCVDKVCCDATCTGQCEACDVSGHAGTCWPVKDAPHSDRSACAGGSPECAGSCDGVGRAVCAYPSKDISCGTPSCTNGQSTRSTCNGKGECSADSPIACSPFKCGATACKDTCAADNDCDDGFRCETTTSRCVPSTGKCTDINTSEDSKGVVTKCAPYTCQSGACLKSCSSSSDCASGNVCDSQQGNGTCVAAAANAGDSSDSGGCGCATPGHHRSPAGLVGLMLLFAWKGLRRRSAGCVREIRRS
jgi:hypothetical protein